MMPKVRRKDRSRAASGGVAGTTNAAESASSHPTEGPSRGAPDWGPPEGAPQGVEAPEGDAPRSSRRRSRRLRDRSPPDYSADEILSLVTAQHHHHPQQHQQQQQQEQQQRQQQRQKRRAVPRSMSSSKPSSRRSRHDADREGPLHADAAGVGPLNLSRSSGKHEGRGPSMGAPSYRGKSSASSSSSMRALGMGAAAATAAAATAAAAAAEDEPCVLVPLKQARALLASASPAAVQMAAAAAAGGAPLSRDPVLPHDAFSVGGGGAPWGGAPRLEALPPEGPPHASTPLPEALSFEGPPPHKSTHPFRHASLSLTSLPASRPPFLNGGGGFLDHPRAPFPSHEASAQGPPFQGGPHGGAPPRGARQGPKTTDPRAFALPQHPWDQFGRGPRGRPLEASDLGGSLEGIHGGPLEGPPSHYYRRRSSSSDLPFSSASPLQEMRARRPSLRGPYEYRGLSGAPLRGPSHGGGRGPRTPERFPHHPQPSGEGPPLHSMSRRRHDEQQRQQAQPFPQRVDARGATVGRLWGSVASAAGGGPPPVAAASASLRRQDAERPPSAATAAGREGPPTAGPTGGPSETPFLRGPITEAPTEAPLLLSRQGAPKEAPTLSRWKEIERQYLRAPAPAMGALRAPPDTPAAAAVLHLEGPPSSSLSWQQGPVGGPSSGNLPSAAPPGASSSSGGPSRTAAASELLQGPPGAAEVSGAPSAGGPSEARRGLPSLSSLAEVLAPTAGSSSGGPLGPPLQPSRAAGPPPPPAGPKTVSGVFIDAAFPPGAPQRGPLGGAHSRQALSLVATAAAKTTLAVLRRGEGPPCLRLPWGRHEGPLEGTLSRGGAPKVVGEHSSVEVLEEMSSAGAEHIQQPQQQQQHQHQPTLESLRASVAALIEAGAPARISSPVQIDAAATALAAVRLTPAVRMASAAGAAAATAAAAAAADSAAEASDSSALGDALSAASDLLMKVLAATLDAWLLALSDKQREGSISTQRAEVLGKIAEVAAAVAAQNLQERAASMRDAAETVSLKKREEAQRERRSFLSLQTKQTALRVCLLQRAEKWKVRFLALHAGTTKRLAELAAAEKLLRSLNASAPSLLDRTPVRPLDLDDNELRLRLARPRTLKALKVCHKNSSSSSSSSSSGSSSSSSSSNGSDYREDSLAVAQKTGELQKVREAALMVQRRHLRKVEAEVVVRTVQATKMLEALGRKRREALSFAALLHRRVMPETDERKVLARLQQVGLSCCCCCCCCCCTSTVAASVACRQGALEPEELQESNNEGGGPWRGGPRRSSFEGRLSDSSLFTSSYPHPRGEGFRFSLSSLLNDPLPPPKDGEEQENQPLVAGEQQQQPEGQDESSGVRTPERIAPAAAQNKLQTLGRTLEELSLKKTAATVTGAAAAAAAATAAAPAAAAAAVQTAAATPVRMGLSRHPATANGFQATFSLRSLVGSRRLR
ncbi:hypothetical protein Emed_007402 [Eimeria media]